MQHRYKVGQMLELRSAPRHSNRPAGLCEVLACLPHDAGPVLYRVQSMNERNERVVEESDLAPSSAVAEPVRETGESLFTGIPIGRR
jgi:hypothetical protein